MAGRIRQLRAVRLRRCHQAKAGVSGCHKLHRLGDVLAEDEVGLHLLPHAGLLQECLCGCAVRRGDGICNGQAARAELVQRRPAITAGKTWIGRPQYERADRVGETRPRNRDALCFQALRPFAVGGQKSSIARAVASSRVQNARRRRRYLNDMTGRLLEGGDEFFHRRNEVTGYPDGNRLGIYR